MKIKIQCKFSLLCMMICLIACDDPAARSTAGEDEQNALDSGMYSGEDDAVDQMSARQDSMMNLPDMIDQPLMDMEISDQSLIDMEIVATDMEGVVTDMEMTDMEDVTVDMEVVTADMAVVAADMEIIAADMDIVAADMEMTGGGEPQGAQLREPCAGSSDCAMGLSCLGWPTGSFCTTTCGYNPPASGLPSDPPCPEGYALECHVSNQCLPARCQGGCDSGYECDDSGRCAPTP
jgi:hypothetical protein